MSWWVIDAAANLVIMVAYLAISFAIATGLWRSQQWLNNLLGLATAAIFFTCAVHHGSHTVHMVLPSLGLEVESGLAMRAAFGHDFHAAAWDIVTAIVAVWYWTLRSRFPALVRGAAVFEDLKLRQASEARLRASEERYRGIVETTNEGVLLLDAGGRIDYINARFAEIVGRPMAQLHSVPLVELVTDDDRATVERTLTRAGDGQTHHVEVGLSHPDGPVVQVQIAVTARLNDTGGGDGTLAMVTDVTEQKNVEAQLRQAQKLDAVGQLAGGVAHDFNNLLTVIDGYAALLLGDVTDEAARRDLTAIRDAAARAGGLTHQLLAFSRTQAVRPQAVDVNALVAGTQTMLCRLIREDIDLRVAAVAEPATVWVDRGQLEQVLVNLVVNARDAMPGSGTLTIRTHRVDLDHEGAVRQGVRAGGYVALTVTDTGCGMTPEVAARIFEPFFTTKDQGKGTGLGLSTVYGIVRQAGGHIQVDSAPGTGTTIDVYLPASSLPADAPEPDETPQTLPTGTEKILLVEDEPALRELTQRILHTAGYRVLAASNARQALELSRAHADIDLLLTDVIMPGMNGRQLAHRLAAVMPGLPVVFTSAYAHGVLTDDPNAVFLGKPFTAAALTETIRATIDAHPGPPAARVDATGAGGDSGP
ncbi:ATP-binding protein [Longispora urticae]